MKRFSLMAFMLVALSAIYVPVCSAGFEWTPRTKSAYQLVVGATTYIEPVTPVYSEKLDIPDRTSSISITVRSGTSTIEYSTTSISGNLSEYVFDFAIFDRPEIAKHFLDNAAAIVTLPAVKTDKGTTTVVYTPLNGSALFTTYGSYQIPINRIAGGQLIFMASTVADSTKVNNEGLTFEVLFNRE